jgi:hypothetical protein
MNDQTPQTPATPDGAASVLTVGLGVLRPHELEVYDELIGLYFYEQTNGSKKLWWRPMDLGGHDGSHHSRTLAKLVKLGLAERRQRGSLTGIRGSWEYRALDTPNVKVTGLPQPADGSDTNNADCGRSG